jgi:hydroxyacylglutathione hydrolase
LGQGCEKAGGALFDNTHLGVRVTVEINILPALNDNYIYVFLDRDQGAVGLVDPGEAGPIVREIERRGWRPSVIFNTHHHDDHIAGDLQMKTRYRCPVIGPAAEWTKIPELDVGFNDGDTYEFGGQTIQVISTPGHTRGHCVFYLPAADALFCGDTLFSLGCGRLFEGTPGQMWDSLSRLMALPDRTRLYCGHEYTQANARFALSIEPENHELRARVLEIETQRASRLPTVPTTLGQEKATNPFLRVNEPAVRAALGMERASPVEVFTELRHRKDRF